MSYRSRCESQLQRSGVTQRRLVCAGVLAFLLAANAGFAESAQGTAFEFQGLPVVFDGPGSDASGVIYVFHGRGGGVEFLSRAVTQRTLDPLKEAGFAIVGTESQKREPRSQWDIRDREISTNRDLQRLLALHAELIDRGWIASDTPMSTLGMSNGAFMAILFAAVATRQGIDVGGVVAIQGGFRDSILEEIEYDRPTFYVLVANELLVNNAFVASGCDYLRSRGTPCELRMLEEQPLDRAILTHYGVDADEATEALAALKANGWLDASGDRAVPVDRYESGQSWVSALSEMGVTDPNAVFQALRHAWALHLMRDDYRDEQTAFLQDNLPE